MKNKKTATSSFTATDLYPYTTYSIRYTAVNEAGQSGLSDAAVIRTAPGSK